MKSKILFSFFAILLHNLANAQCAVFVDNFESGATTVWTAIGAVTTSATNVSPALGNFSGKIVGGGLGNMQGVTTTVTASTPSVLSWYMKPTGTGQSNTLVAGDASITAARSMVFCYWLGSTNEIVFTGSTAALSYKTIVTPGSWYLIELKNINFTTHKFDIYINGVLKQANFAFRSNLVNNISKFHLYNFDAGTTGYWDEIKMGTNSSLISNASASNAASIAGFNIDTDNQGAGQTILYTTSGCNLISTIQSASNLGSTSAKVTVETLTPTYNTQPYVKRWYDINPTVQGAATITLYFTQNDFTNYNTYASANSWPLLPQNPTDAVGKANVRVTKNTGALGVNPVVLTPTSVTWNATNGYWEVLLSTPGFSQFRLHAVNPLNSALPVALGDFSGKKVNTSNILNWNTITENNCKSFEVQRSSNGKDYVVLGMVNSQSINGSSNFELNYSFIDENPKQGHNYYRLRQIDLDDRSTFSKEIDLVWSTSGSVVSVYPNPANSNLNIEYASENEASIMLNLIDMSGRMVKQIQTKSIIGNNLFTISLEGISVGMYQLQLVENNRMSYVQKVVKQ